ncbi:VanW family protein [Salana multivorans]|uniref:VanW family protein n=1 Tax=Salana multivorans TaxID=120377 RepID=UPI000F4C16B7|nr:VanW family protein [Salana multivorans]
MTEPVTTPESGEVELPESAAERTEIVPPIVEDGIEDAVVVEDDEGVETEASLESGGLPEDAEPDRPESDAELTDVIAPLPAEPEAVEPEAGEPDLDPAATTLVPAVPEATDDAEATEATDDAEATTVVPLAAAEPERTEVLPETGSDDGGDDSDGGDDTPAGLLDEMPEERRSGRTWKVLTGVGIGIVVLAGVYLGGVFYTADRTPPNATVSGVDVGGMTTSDAVSTVRAAFDPRADAAIPLTIGEIEATIEPAAAGLTYDPEASVGQITGRSWDPRVIWERLAGTVDVEAVTHVDQAALEEQLDEAASYVAVAPQDAAIVFADGRAVVTDPVDGAELDVPGAVAIISEDWLTAEGSLDLPLSVVTPDLDQAAVDAAMSTIVDPMMSAPVTLQAGEQQLAIEPVTLTEISSLVGADGAFELVVDPTKVAEVVATGLPDLGGEPKDASFQFVDGVPTVVPAVEGTGIDAQQIADVVAAAAIEPTGRVATAELVSAEPEFTTAAAEALGPLEVIGEFSTPMPYDPPRTENLVIGTGRITGTVVMPGQEFSLLGTIGPISTANGYNVSHGVDQGLVVDVAGGGLSQLSTTTFNAAFEAGMVDVEHRPHTRWFDRYPPGREATVNDPGLDMRWRNNTPYPILMQAGVADSRTWVKLWSVPYWDVEIVSGAKYNFTSSKTIYNTKANCQAESGGKQGFSINVERTVSRDGVVDTEASGTLSWTYTAWPKVVCGPDPATLPPPTPEAPAEG